MIIISNRMLRHSLHLYQGNLIKPNHLVVPSGMMAWYGATMDYL